MPDVEELGEEEVDEFNSETFGADMPSEEWELDHLAQQTAELLKAGESKKVVVFIHFLLIFIQCPDRLVIIWLARKIMKRC